MTIPELQAARGRVELHLLVSLARSQRALTRMLEHAADQVAGLELPAQAEVLTELRALARHQQIITAKLTGALSRSNKKRGTPALPWINGGVRAGGAASRFIPSG